MGKVCGGRSFLSNEIKRSNFFLLPPHHHLLALGVSRKSTACSAARSLALLSAPSLPPGRGATTLASASVTRDTAAPPAKNSRLGTARTRCILARSVASSKSSRTSCLRKMSPAPDAPASRARSSQASRVSLQVPQERE